MSKWNRLSSSDAGTTGAGVIVNPCDVAAGGLAAYRVGVEPEDEVEDDDINWSVANGGVTFYGGRDTGREVIVRGGAAGSDFKLEVRIGGAPATACPYIHGRVLEPTVTPIHVYIICDANGTPAVSTATVDAWVAEANRIYTQAAMSFYVAGVEHVVNRPDWFVVTTNFSQMCSYASNTGGLELYCVGSMSSPGRHSDMALPLGAPRCGMAVRADANLNTLAHEIGHACNLRDIVDSPVGVPVSETLSGALNWSGGEGTGYHDPALMHDALIRRLLMFYMANPQKADISLAAVTGQLPDTPYDTFISVGLLNMRNRNPRH